MSVSVIERAQRWEACVECCAHHICKTSCGARCMWYSPVNTAWQHARPSLPHCMSVSALQDPGPRPLTCCRRSPPPPQSHCPPGPGPWCQPPWPGPWPSAWPAPRPGHDAWHCWRGPGHPRPPGALYHHSVQGGERLWVGQHRWQGNVDDEGWGHCVLVTTVALQPQVVDNEPPRAVCPSRLLPAALTLWTPPPACSQVCPSTADIDDPAATSRTNRAHLASHVCCCWPSLAPCLPPLCHLPGLLHVGGCPHHGILHLA